MIHKVKNTAAVILAAAGMMFAVVAPAASAAPVSTASKGAAAPDFTCPARAVCTFYGERLNNTGHVWWPGRVGGRWHNFHNLHVNNPGSVRDKSAFAVWVGTQAGGVRGQYRCAPGNTPGSFIIDLHHHYGWFFITATASCGPRPPALSS